MSRHRSYFPRDQAPAIDGDPGFVRVNAKSDPDKLQPSELRSATNIELRRNVAETRRGCKTPTFARVLERTIALHKPSAIYGAGKFSDPNGVEWMLLATDTGVWRVRQFYTPRRISTPEPLDGSTTVLEFVQAFQTVILFRGADLAPWSWSGSLDDGFEEIPKTTGSAILAPIPNGSDRPGLRPVLMAQRLIVPHGRNNIAVSDILDYTVYDKELADYDLTTGTDDTLTALYPFANSGLLCFKDQSIALLSGVAGVLEALQLTTVNAEVGCVAGKTVAQLGGDVLFLSGTGVFKLTQVVQERLQTAPVAVSEAIRPLIDRINWKFANRATAVVFGDYYYLAVPLDGAEVNNAVLAYNTVRDAWEGVHEWPGVQIDELILTDFDNRKHPYAVDLAAGRVLRLYDGLEDCIGDTPHAIAWEILSRGYTANATEQKLFRRGALPAETWDGAFTVSVEMDGVLEAKTVLSKTLRNTKYFVFDVADYDASNANDDHSTARREDYAVKLSTPFVPFTGVVPGRFQAFNHRLPIGRRGRWMSVRISGTRGAARISGLQIECEETQRAMRDAA